MPITIRWPDATHVIGPGFSLWVHTDLSGPIETGTRFQVVIGPDVEGTNPIMVMTFVAQQHDGFVQVGEPSVTDHQTLQSAQRDGEPTHVISNLIDPRGNITDSGSETATWSPTAQVWQHVTTVGSTSGGAGFTATDRQLLTDTERRSLVLGEPTDLTVNTPSGLLPLTLGQLFSRSFVNNLVLSEVTGGETCEPVRFNYNEWYAGIAINVTTIDPELTPKTPDQDWYFPDLAVLRIFRGSHLRFRRGIHTPTFITDEPYEWGWNIRNVLEALGAPPATTVAVDWRAGCCGRVYLVRIP